MNDRDETIIEAIIKKADVLCPDSLALIGVYGSVVTGDEYEKSDLDLMILINDESGQVLAEGFIIDDVDIGYDLYCTSWDMLENDA
ncbi:MAG: nucleotidyltransferase domain-containing protein, partial [Lachnospiraceae bacterium]|nr:nucleotidyltransferase domain-containing protein [Lachnospiraceae bacterium]